MKKRTLVQNSRAQCCLLSFVTPLKHRNKMYLSKFRFDSGAKIIGRYRRSFPQYQIKLLPQYFARSSIRYGTLEHSCAFSSSSYPRFCQTSYLRLSTNVALKNLPEENENIFPTPKHSLGVLETRLQSIFGRMPVFSINFRKLKQKHVCELELHWPETCSFSSEKQKKAAACNDACLQALQWLYSNKFITKASEPILKDEADVKNKYFINLNESVLNKVDDVLKMYSEEVAQAIPMFHNVESFADDAPYLPLSPTSEEIEWSRRDVKVPNSRNVLPIDAYREKIMQSIKSNRVILLKGETGCGKTTRVPQYILDDALVDDNQRAPCNIVVVQPRRLTTIETAKFVAKERKERIGKTIGYSVKMSSVYPSIPGSCITFMTGMKLALKFASNPSLVGVTHVVLDEVHLRDVGTDLVMTLLKRAMKINTDLRVIIMSATVDTKVFQLYFNQIGSVPVVEVPGRTFPVKMHFLDDLPQSLINGKYGEDSPKIDYPQVQKLVSWINKTKPAGAILIFVSGWKEMLDLRKILTSEKNLDIIPVHSMFRDCSSAFKPSAPGVRKVIVATNVAETSITFPDVVYVIDCGVHKKPHRNVLSPGGWSTTGISTEWVTKANVLQRKGRAGRVQPGESYHLFSKATFFDMEDYEPPGILSSSLEHLVLSVKMVDPNTEAQQLLKEFPDPPHEGDVRNAVRTLQSVSLLTYVGEKPTPLAKAVMKISTSLPSALALIYSSIFRCFHSTLPIISCEEAPLRLNNRSEDDASQERSLKASYHSSSDHLAKAKAMTESPESFVSNSSYKQTRALNFFLEKQVTAMSEYFMNADLDQHTNEELVKSILLNCFGSLMVKCHTLSLKPFVNDKSGIPASIKSRSVNHKLEKLESPFVMYLSGRVSHGILFVDNTSTLSPLSVLLFLPSKLRSHQVVGSENVIVKAWSHKHVFIVMPKTHFVRIQELRKAIRHMQNYFVKAEALNEVDENYDLLCSFRKKLLDCLKEMLNTDCTKNTSVTHI